MKLLATLMVALAILLAGLLAFADRVARSTPASAATRADGIAALTGGSDIRLRVATSLLQSGMGRRLLLSGVNRSVTRAEIWQVIGAAKPVFDCCVDLDFAATDTIGNARETARWARAMGYHSLILVTADYHAPRATLELKAAAPEINVSAFPVATSDLDAAHWWRTSLGARRMIGEYGKYLATLGRRSLLGLGARDRRGEEPANQDTR